jgi:hypothetical protein
MPYHAHILHQAPTHPRYATQQALLFLDVRIALVNPTGAATILTRVSPVDVLSACLRASERSWDVRQHCRVQRLYIRDVLGTLPL